MMSVPVVIALGGNLGDVRSTGEAALKLLHETSGLEVEQVSAWYTTEPVGCEGRFLNAAARLQSELTPTQLLQRMSEIETQYGRERTGHWTPRPIDLDLIAYRFWRVDHSRLKVPHPLCWSRRFVLDPVCEVAGQMLHPGLGMTFDALRARLIPRPLPLAWSGDLPRDTVVTGAIHDRFGDQICWVEPQLHHVTRFVPEGIGSRGPFEIAVPADLTESRRIVSETLTALLDKPFVEHR
jgi:2-amino-4-hydroxy-6-hydroxymethyldihydropteridine diphosphokinase